MQKSQTGIQGNPDTHVGLLFFIALKLHTSDVIWSCIFVTGQIEIRVNLFTSVDCQFPFVFLALVCHESGLGDKRKLRINLRYNVNLNCTMIV